MPTQGYRELKVWQSSLDLAKQCYFATKLFPKDELFGLTSQIRRSAGSIPANIAEGAGRQQRKAFLNFLNIARGSLKELETHLILSNEVALLDSESLTRLLDLSDQVGRMLAGLQRSLRRKL